MLSLVTESSVGNVTAIPGFLVPKLCLGTPLAKLRFAPSSLAWHRRETEFREVGSQTEFGNQGVSFLTLDSVKEKWKSTGFASLLRATGRYENELTPLSPLLSSLSLTQRI